MGNEEILFVMYFFLVYNLLSFLKGFEAVIDQTLKASAACHKEQPASRMVNFYDFIGALLSFY